MWLASDSDKGEESPEARRWFIGWLLDVRDEFLNRSMFAVL